MVSPRRLDGALTKQGPGPAAVADSHRVRIESIASGGEGVGRLDDGRVVFVHRTAPGDVAEVSLTEVKERWARGRLLRVLEPSAARRPPLCTFYDRCGGCTLEHLEYAAQLDVKRGIVGDALTRIGRLDVDVPLPAASPRETRYRNRVSFTLRRFEGARVVAGFHALGEPDTVLDIDGRCLLPEPAVAEAWDGLRAAWGPGAARLPRGDELRLTLRGTAAGRVSLLIEGGRGRGEPDDLISRVESLDAIWHRPRHGEATLLAGEAALRESWGGEEIPLAGSAFLQVNRAAAALLEAHVLDLARTGPSGDVVDAYCGAGLHARRLARDGARVIGIELDGEAVRAARAAGVEGARFVEGRVEDHLPAALPCDLLILNPPRDGIGKDVAAMVVAAPPTRVIYISCNPATLARDLRWLSSEFEVAHIATFDMFPQTAHVESVVELIRGS